MESKLTLETLDQKIDFLLERLEEHAQQDRVDFTRINESLHGNGKPGMNLRLDRLEQTEKRRGKQIWVIFTALVGGVVSWIGMLLK